MSVKQRIAHALAASAFGQSVTIGSQLLLTPLFFRYWGPGLYGEWLILSSVPAYLTMTDLGIGSAAGNEMTMRAGAGDQSGAQQTYRGAHWVALAAGIIGLLIGLGLAAMAIYWEMPRTTLITPTDAGAIVALLALSISINFHGSVTSAGFRAAGRNALGISLSNTARLLEAISMGCMLILGVGPLVLCAVALSVKAVMLLVQHVCLHRLCPWLHHPRVPADLTLVKRLIAPSLGFMAFPLGNALALQGPILIIGHFMGGPAVAIFSATRTLARVPMQITNMFNSSVWPEMSRAHGAGDIGLLRTLHRASWGMTLVLVLGCGLTLMVLGSWFADIWLGSSANFEPRLLAALVMITVISAIWNSSSVVLSAINAHAGLGARYVIVNASCLALAWALTPAFGWWGLLPALVLAELVLFAWVIPQVMTTTHDHLSAFMREGMVEGMMKLFRLIKARASSGT
jgi:O-antigen/teichoic acid export membrane protein